ncbi:hypothetical protein HOY80DRAFT_1135389 [Tuber brumale]|nr:hypothetical protein HOY80DRAFT_1135389 [Tuber brumale]
MSKPSNTRLVPSSTGPVGTTGAEGHGLFRGGMEQLKTADGITLYVHKSMLDQELVLLRMSREVVSRLLRWSARPTSSVDDSDEHADGVFHTAADYLPRYSDDEINVCKFSEHGHGEGGNSTRGGGNGDDGTWGNGTEDNNDKDDSGSSGYRNGLDYFIVFLAHVELYILSQIQRRGSLTALCLDRLREALDKAAKAPVCPQFANNLSHVLFYAYNISECSGVRLVDDQAHNLQNLVSSYATMHIKEMKGESAVH